MKKPTLPKSFATIYDNGGKTLDRYTIVFNNTRGRGIYTKYVYDCIAASENGLGVFQWSNCAKSPHLGKQINFTDLSITLQNMIINSVVFSNDESIQYHREPTEYEIKFGEGATHYKSFDKFYCTDVKGNIKKHVVCPIDGLIYTL